MEETVLKALLKTRPPQTQDNLLLFRKWGEEENEAKVAGDQCAAERYQSLPQQPDTLRLAQTDKAWEALARNWQVFKQAAQKMRKMMVRLARAVELNGDVIVEEITLKRNEIRVKNLEEDNQKGIRKGVKNVFEQVLKIMNKEYIKNKNVIIL
jgi:hypothetical protein